MVKRAPGDGFTRSDSDAHVTARGRSATGATNRSPESAAGGATETAVYALVVDVGGVVCCAGRDKDVRLLDPTDGCCLHRMSGHAERVWSLCRTDRDELFSGSADKTIKKWRVGGGGGACLGTYKGHKGAVMSLLKHRGLLISGSQDQTVRLWDLREGGCVGSIWQSPDSASKEKNAVHSLTMARRDQLAAGTWGGTVRTWDLHRTRCTATFDAHSGAVWSLLHADGKLFSAGSDGTVRLWDTRTNGQGPVGTLGSAATSGPLYTMVERDGLLLTGGYDQLVKVWDHRMMRCLNELPGHSGSVRCLAFLNNTLLSGSTDGTVRLWDFNSLLAHEAPGADLGATGGTVATEAEYGGYAEEPAVEEYDKYDDRIDSPPEAYAHSESSYLASP